MAPSKAKPGFNQLVKQWWWFVPAHGNQKCEAALIWETVRRTKSYQALWRKFRSDSVPIIKAQRKAILATAFQSMHILQRQRGAVGEPYWDFLVSSFDPNSNWLELSEEQRLKARGFVVHGDAAVKANTEYRLPGKQAATARVGLGMVDLIRNEAGRLVVSRDVRLGGMSNVTRANYPLALKPGRFAYVHFDTCETRDALLRAFDEELRVWVGDWKTGMKKAGRLPVSWNGAELTPVEFWAPDPTAEWFRLKPNEFTLIPAEEPGFAILLVSARHNPATVKATFGTQLRTAQFAQWHPRCVKHWKTLKVEFTKPVSNSVGHILLDEKGLPLRRPVVRYLFDPKKHLPQKNRQVRSGRPRHDLWLGIAVHDAKKQRLSLGKTSETEEFLLNHCDKGTKPAALWNHQRSAAARLKKLEDSAGRLDKNLAHWNRENLKFAKMGLFKAAAGEKPPGGGE